MHFKRLRQFVPILVVFMMGLVPAIASAHVEAGETSGFLHGLGHPFGGLDHILAMVAVGLWSAQLERKLALPMAFLGAMILGGLLGAMGWEVPMVEQGIIASDFILGGLVLMATRMSLPLSLGLVGILAMFHGYAHGAEMPANASGWEYGLGFILATAALHAMGLGLAIASEKFSQANLIRITGGVIIVASAYVLATA